MATNVQPRKSLSKQQDSALIKTVIYIVCIILALLSIAPFYIMIVNSTRSTESIQHHALSLIPGSNLAKNWKVFEGKTFNVGTGFLNSGIIAVCSTVLNMYFSALTAYALTAYEWKLREPFFKVIMGVMMIPAQCTTIGFYQMAYKLHLTDNLLMLILPSIAAPMTVFFLRQYLQASLEYEIIQSGRIDGAGEFRIFNSIILPIMKPAIATQAIFSFVGSWNNLFLPMILLTDKDKYTMPIMIGLLNGDIYRTEHGAIYLGLTLTVIPLIVVYLLLSKYIVEGVAVGSVK